MSEDTNAKLNELTAFFRHLMGKRKPKIEEEYLFFTPIIPATELSIYAKLAKALSSINEDRKTAVYTYFKTVTEDPEVTFANTMRVLLSDIATSKNQNRLSNLHKAMELPGRNVFDLLLEKKKIDTRKRRIQPFPQRQPIGSVNGERGIQDPIQDPIIHENDIGEPEAVDLQWFEKKKLNKWSGCFTAFGDFGQYGPKFLGWPSADIKPTAEQEEVNQGSERHTKRRIIVAAGKARYRGRTATKSWILHSNFHD
ncbi:hypothetical protein AYI68_g2566 [Smittium mucronatum]|uniref:Uncharacterized protein n=1 Tax=Smittium mucronatum TaxID=133383 RepID=A0A1R0H2G1_9FUNG|nr:hypothetical protein AYI68_g8179 [Smittium mucronatum]OLY83297.1 hypothetical protein AYI68_g2566 [Smittium mucronatum]